MNKIAFILSFLFLAGCIHDKKKSHPHITEEVVRNSTEKVIKVPDSILREEPYYPWKKKIEITKEYFACKGSRLHPANITLDGTKEISRFYDCGGSLKHSLPIKDDSEHIYFVLIDILNYIQKLTKKPVIITSGHRCPVHNVYLDPSPKNSGSKHLIGAEVDFYVQGYEDFPEKIVESIFLYYKTHPILSAQKEYITFERSKIPTNTAIPPWYNKEIFIKLFSNKEGRNFDNRHSFPYISIQVRFDRIRNEKVVVTNEQAQRYLRK